MSGKRYSILFLLLTGLVVGGVFLSGKLVTFTDVMDADDYLASLSESDTFGLTHSTRVAPEVLVIGDSHAYTAINFNILAEALGTKRIGSCTLGGSTVETLLFALEHYESLGKLPKTVILTTSARQFMVGRNREKQMAQHKAHILSAGDSDMIVSIRNMFAYFSGVKSRRNAFAELSGKERALAPKVEAMDEDVIAGVLARSNSPKLADNRAVFIHPRYDAGAEAAIDRICELVRRNHIDLYVVDIPESPWLEAQYPASTVQRYHEFLDRYRRCARAVLIYSTRDVGLGNRHFVNRAFDVDYDFGKWSDPGGDPVGDFDVDHMSRVGASLFTPVMARDVAGRMGAGPGE